MSITAAQSIGQSFVAQHGGLNGIAISLLSHAAEPVEILAHLRTDPSSEADLAVSSITIPPDSAPAFRRFVFPPQADSHAAYRYVVLTSDSDQPVSVETGPGGSYLNGSLYVDGQPAESQARFRLSYDPALSLLEVARGALDALRLMAAALLIWALPGWALLSLCLRGSQWRSLPLLQKLGLSAGAGAALYPVLMLWAATIGTRPGPAMLWAPMALAIVVAIWQLVVAYRNDPYRLRPRWPQRLSGDGWADVAAVLALLAVLLTRLLVVRALDAPSWGDSVQHVAMTQLIAEQGGLFNSWLPYTPYGSLTVQYGFASNAAILMQLLRLTSVEASLIAGQLLGVLAIVVLYPLAVRLAGGNRWAGVCALIVGGLLSPMPAFYVNWGRYAQLAGQVVLPVALWLTLAAVERARFHAGATIAAGLTLTGMMLSYYRMPYNYAVFMLLWLCFCGIPGWGRDGRRWVAGVAGLGAIAVAALVLVLPWLDRVADSTLAERVASGFIRGAPLAAVQIELAQWRTITEYAPTMLLAIGGVALAWAFLRRQWAVFMIGPWVLVMAALVAARLIKLPGANQLQTFAVMIMLYIPLSLLIGWLGGEVLVALSARWRATGPATITAGLVAAILLGSANQLKTVQPDFVLVTRPDARAMSWIKANTPSDAVFLVEGFRVYAGRSAVGSDAGWWIPLMANRGNTMPPQYALMNEKPIDPAYSQSIIDLVATLETQAPRSDAVMAKLCKLKVTHVYIGQTQGETGMGVSQLFSAADFLNDSRFTLAYHQDRVYIFALASDACKVWARASVGV